MKRFLALLLSLCLVASLVPVNGIIVSAEPAHSHYACSCALTGGNACAGHGSDAPLTWSAWTDTSKLPNTTGNYYLTGNINLTNMAHMAVSSGQVVNLCLNGYSVKFNASNTAAGNYNVYAGGKLTIMNCQAKLDSKGLFVSGNKANPADLTAGRLYGARYNSGGAIQTSGEVNLIGVELYDNGKAGTGNGGAVRLYSGVLNAVHTKFDSNKANYGGAVNKSSAGNVSITLDDCLLTNNQAVASSSGNGGAIYLKSFAADTQDLVLTLKGDTRVTGNQSYSSGCAIYASSENKSAAAYNCRVVLQDNVQITGNRATRTSGAAKGAVSMDTGGSAGKKSVLAISGNVQVKNNSFSSTDANNAENVAFTNAKVTLEVGEMGQKAYVVVRTSAAQADPDNFAVKAASTNIADNTSLGIVYVNSNQGIYYKQDGGFYYGDVPVQPVAHTNHHACACAITGSNGCAGHGSDPALTWTEWTDTATLPTTTGNYYLTDNITLTNTAAMEIAAGQTVNLCLNGYSVQFNSANTAAANYSVAAGATLTVMNCQASLDAKGLLNTAATSRMYGGRGNKGGAIYTEGTVNLLGVELYDNGLPGSSSLTGGAVRMGAGAVLNALHAKFDSNKARYGAAIGNVGKNVTITLDDTILSNNEAIGSSAGNGGAIYLKGYTAGTQDCLLTVKGDSRITGNRSYSSGCAIYASTENSASATTACRIVLQDNVVISGNEATRTSGAAKGAVSMDTGANSGKVSLLAVSGNVQIKDNTYNSTAAGNAHDVSLTNAKAKLEVGAMGADADVRVYTAHSAADPNGYVTKAAGATLAQDADLGISCENTDPAQVVYYNTTDGFYYYTEPVTPPVEAHTHYACACAITGSNGCAGHGSDPALTWTAWTDAATLPTTTGNYYLTGNINLTNTAAMEIAAGQNVNLCLNGYSVQFNSANTAAANYSVAAGANLTVMNCKASLDAKGLLNATGTSRMYGGRGNKGGAIYAEGTVNLLGIEMYDNGVANTGSGGAVQLSGGTLNALHTKFDSNKAKTGAVVSNVTTYGIITMDDVIATNNVAGNSSSGNGGLAYLKGFTSATQWTTLTLKGDSRVTGNSSGGSGGVMYICTEGSADATTACRVVLQDNVTITGNTTGTGSTKGAIAMDASSSTGVVSTLSVSGNVQIKDNTALSTNAAAAENAYLHSAKNKLEVGTMGADAEVYLYAKYSADEPNGYMIKATGATLTEDSATGINCENTDPAQVVYYNTTDGFYYYTEPVIPPTPTVPDHFHHACSCAITGGNACAGHGTEEQLGWVAWTNTATLPTTTGNYYLTGNITLTNAAAMNIAADQDVKLCLNGYSVQFDSDNIGAANYSVAAGATLTVMNCKASLDAKGLLTETGNSRMYGGRGNQGGAIYAAGTVNLLGIELYDNGVTGTGYGGAIKLGSGAELNVLHSKFDSNKGRYGAAIGNDGGNVTITLDDTLLTENEAIAASAGNGGAIYMKSFNAGTEDCTLTIKGDSKLTGNRSYSSGSAIYVNTENSASATTACQVILQDNVVISGNQATRSTGAAKGAVAMDAGTNSGKVSVLTVLDNVQVKDNTVSSTNDANANNIGISNAKNKLEIGELGADADIWVSTASTYDDPDGFMSKVSGAVLTERTDVGVTYEKIQPAQTVGYDTVEDFYLFDPTLPPLEPHNHHDCACAITGDSACKHEGAEMSWKAWTRTDRLPVSGNYYLTGDVVITGTAGAGTIGQYEIQEGQELNLCLNGHNIKFYDKNTNKGNYYSMIGSQLTIMNCKAAFTKDGKLVDDAQNGGLISGGRGRYGGAIYVKGDAKLIGVAFKDNKAAYDDSEGMGGAIRVQDGGKLLVQHCLFENNHALANGGAICSGRGEAEVTVEDCVFTNNTSPKYGGAIAMNSAASKLTIKDSVITKSTATETGGAIYAVKCQMNISGTTISDNEARNGGAIYLSTNSTLDITDSVIEGNEGTNSGGVYAIKQSKVTLGKGTVIRKNQAASGGGVILQTKSEMTFAGGSVENNKASSGGGMTLWDQSVVYLKDGKIVDNEATVGAGGGIYMQSGADLHVSGGQLSGNKSKTYGGGVYANMNDKVKTIDITVSGGEIANNYTGNAGGGIYALSAKMVISGGKIANNEAKTSGGGIYLGSSAAAGEVLGNFTMTGGEISGNKTATGGGVYHSTNTDVLYSGGILTKNQASTSGGAIHMKKARVVFEDILIAENESKSGGGICLQNETQLDFRGGKVEKNTGSSGGGAMLWSKSVLNLNGGLIQNNKSTGSGGGVYMQSGSYLYVNSGKITGNTSTKAGGGVFSNGNNTDRMTIKTTGGEISNNTAGTQGGGVYVGGAKAGSAMTMVGGSVKNNRTVEQQGGGIYVAANCSLTMWGGSVSGNFTKQTGGGIYANKGTIIINGGSVTYNKCNASGGGIHTSGGKLEMNGGSVSYNYAGAYGGGIRTYSNTEFTMTEGSVTHNEAENRGGGIALWSNMTMTGGRVNYNAVIGDPDGKDTNTYGGGIAICDNNSVYVKDHYTLDITGAEFIGNTSLHKGGALSVTGETYLYVKDSLFEANEAPLGGAIIADNHKNNRSVPSELYVYNCQFTGNKAEDGGAIYGNWASETTVEDSIFTANTATKAGGAIHLRSESMGWINTSFFAENTAGTKGAAIYCADDAQFHSLTITGNNSGDGYAFYIEEGAYDGLSVVKAIVKISGDMVVYENIGAKPDMFIGKNAMVHVNYEGLGKNTNIHVELAEGILTDTLIGVYNYEGGNLDYMVTYGERSITEPEAKPQAQQPDEEQTEPSTEPVATEPGTQDKGLSIGGIAAISGALVVAVIAVIAAVAVKKKKKAGDTAKDTVGE